MPAAQALSRLAPATSGDVILSNITEYLPYSSLVRCVIHVIVYSWMMQG